MKYFVLLAAVMSLPLPAAAQGSGGGPAPRMLPEASLINGASGKRGSIDIYSFVTLPGETNRTVVNMKSKTPVEVRLLDPAGNVIVQQNGVGTVALEAVSSWGDVYSVAVIRADSTAPYTIERERTPASLERFIVAHMAGYRRDEAGASTSCWIVPGETLRTDYGDHVTERSMREDMVRMRILRKDRPVSIVPVRMAIEGEVVAITEVEEGETYRRTLSLDPARVRFDPHYKFVSYTC
ncbi:hypothetical protein [Sphingopyxis sp. R3-92]|uniref:hypothetical protein n=1 Tax=Sphingopyxis sp. R3-92 TaxID=3158553 RepID=UPI003EE63C60